MPRELDVIVFGASGYCGKLVTEHLSRHYLDGTLRWGIAGRSADKLNAILKNLGQSAARRP